MPSGGKREGAGRPVGSKSKITLQIKEAILEAFERAGGADYLLRLSEEDPKVFGMLLSKILPTEITGADGGPIQVSVVRFGDDNSEELGG